MTITKNLQGDLLTLVIEGRLDTTTVGQLETEINDIGADVKNLILDFKALEYVSSAGLRQILIAQKKMAAVGSMKLVGVRPEVYEVLEITGFADMLTIEKA